MEFLANEIEMKNLRNNPLTELPEGSGHYRIKPQRGCFLRCADCLNLSQAESQQAEGGVWHFTNECLFCVQRVIDLLGYYEHGKVPHLIVSAKQKENKHSLGGIYDAILASVKPADKSNETEPISDVFDDCVGD